MARILCYGIYRKMCERSIGAGAGQRGKGGAYMAEGAGLIDEIIEKAGKLPLEEQEHILDVIRAMVSTGRVSQQKEMCGDGKRSYQDKESA